MSISTAASKLRIALKEIETLSYACTNQGTLVEITKSLEEVKSHVISYQSYQHRKDWLCNQQDHYAGRMLLECSKRSMCKLRTKKQCIQSQSVYLSCAN